MLGALIPGLGPIIGVINALSRNEGLALQILPVTAEAGGMSSTALAELRAALPELERGNPIVLERILKDPDTLEAIRRGAAKLAGLVIPQGGDNSDTPCKCIMCGAHSTVGESVGRYLRDHDPRYGGRDPVFRG